MNEAEQELQDEYLTELYREELENQRDIRECM